MPTTKVNGIKLYYEDYGSGYPVVFLHGYAGTTQAWQPQIPVLSQKYRFIIYDARGHGQTQTPPSPQDYSADIVVEDLHQLLKKLSLKKIVLGGLSMGGYESLRFYLRHPEEVTTLILMGTGPGYRNPAHMAEWNRLQEDRVKLLKQGITAFADNERVRSELYYTPRELMLKHNPAGLIHMVRSVIGQHDSLVIESIGKIKVPTLIVVGEKDARFLAAAAYMSKVIPGSKRVTIPGAGHASNLDNTPVFNQAIMNFLEEVRIS